MAPKCQPIPFTPEIIQKAFDLMTEGETERAVFRRKDMPSWRAWCYLKRDHAASDDEASRAFMRQYARAREDKYAAWEDEIVEVAYDESRDIQPDGDGGTKSDNTPVNRDRLKIESLKWLMGKSLPKKYGDVQRQEHSGPDGGAIPIQQQIVDRPPPETREEWEARVKRQIAEQKPPSE